jgi:hypothetical protein
MWYAAFMSKRTRLETHDPNDLAAGWNAVGLLIGDANLIAFDGCHRIYLAMDEIEADFFRDTYAHTVEGVAPNAMLKKLREWYESSCSLRFIQAVWHDEYDPNDGFLSLISQFADDPPAETDDPE